MSKQGAAAGILLGRDLRIAGPVIKGFQAGEIFTISEGGVEFNLKAAHGPVEKLGGFSLWINLAGAKVDVVSELAEDEDALLSQDFMVTFRSEDRSFGLVLNTAQARVVRDILDKYVRARDAWESLRSVMRA